MNKIYITKNGFFTKEKGDLVPISNPLSFYLLYSPKLQKGLTVYDFMNALMMQEKEIDHLFMAFTHLYELKPFWKDLNDNSTHKAKSALDRIVFSWTPGIENEN